MASITPICDFGWKAPDFVLPGTNGAVHTLESVRGPSGTVVMFTCNHCPYVKAVIDRIVRDARDLDRYGVKFVAICSNDSVSHPEDSFDNMRLFAAKHDFTFPYLHDETQSVARAYNAVCTPDFFGFNAALELQYRGRLDGSGRDPAPEGAPRELYEAMRMIARDGRGPVEQTPSVGCSIKWKTQ